MKKNHLFYLALFLILTPLTSIFAKQTEIESFIQRVKATANFVPISDIWTLDEHFDKKTFNSKVEKAEALNIDYAKVATLVKNKPFAINLTFPGINGGSYTIELARYDIFSNEFQVHTLGANGKDEVFNYTPGAYYRGTVNGVPGSIAAFSFFNNEVYGVFSIPGEGNYNLVPNVMVGTYFDYNQHYVLYNDQDLKIKDKGPKCGTDELPEPPAALAKTSTIVGNNVYNNCTEVRVFEVGDYALYRTKGNSATNVTNFLTSLFNNQATIYRNEGVGIVLNYLQVNTATDNYQSITTANSGIFLDTFGKVTKNVMHGSDVAILASTALNGGYGALGGVAWVKCMCATYQASNFFGPYAFCDLDNSSVTNFPTYSWDVEVMSHEMGHQVGSPHTHRCCWNPPSRNTAIDGCYTLEGSCSNPGVPTTAVGGTIMSYCHLVSAGTNFSNGFGTQPGDTIRYFIYRTFSSSCGVTYKPNVPMASVNKTINANRECTDQTTGLTYYWNDNNTAAQADDTLVLIIQKFGNSFGDLNTTGFGVSTNTVLRYGSGTGDTILFPAGTGKVSAKNYAMRRYYKITGATNTGTAVEILFPFLLTDTVDVDGSVPGAAPLSNYRMYRVGSTINPNPLLDSFRYTSASNVAIYTYSTTASSSKWSFTSSGTTNFAHLQTTYIAGGGTLFYAYGSILGTENPDLESAGISIYPNPGHDQWFVHVDAQNTSNLHFQLFTVDGKLINDKALQNGATNTIDASSFPIGMYYYRVINDDNVITGSLMKQ